MKISDIFDGLKADPSRIAVRTDHKGSYTSRCIFWHPARNEFAIYELELAYSRNVTLKEVREIYIHEIASEAWEYGNFNAWHDAEKERLIALEDARKAKEEEKKKAATASNS